MPSGSARPPALVVLVTVPSAAEGRDIGRSIVECRLAACVNVIPGLTSIYRWEGRVEENAEALLVIKSTPEKYSELEAAIRARHPYDVPEILALPVTAGLQSYLAWLADSVE